MNATATRAASWQGRATRFWVLLSALLLACTAHLYAYDAVVAKDGTGGFTTIQAAVTAAPTGRTAAYTIYIKDGIYSEKVTVPSTKPFLQFIGQSVANTILTWNDNALTSNGSGGTLGTGGSGSIVVNATDFSALNMTFVNSYGDGSQAVAVSLYADRAAFENCRFLGNQDTLLTFESGGLISRHYFRDCYIDGNVDFIFGSAIAIFDNCVIYAKTRVVNAATSYITAANTPATQNYGYLFRKAKIPSNNGTTLYYLGRPWQNSTGFTTAAGTLANNKVIFSRTKIGINEVQPAGWVTWDSGTDVTKITFGEFQTKYFGNNGANNVNVSSRVSWSQQLTAADTLNYTLAKLFGTNTGTATSGGAAVTAAWNPATVATDFTTYHAPDIAVSNLQATKGTSQTALQWNISWAMVGIQYALQRSSDNVTFTTINTQTAATDSLYNFAATDGLPTAGTAYYYRVVASKAGLATHTTPSIQVSSIPTITVSTAALSSFAQYSTGTSATQTYTVSGVNMTDNLTITPPANFEVSANGGTNWYTSSTPLVLAPTANTVASTTISVRLNAATVGTYSGNINHTSTGATAVSVAVTGTRSAATQLVSDPLIWWPLIRGVADSVNAAVPLRSPQLVASSPVLRNLYVSNGTTLAAIPAYSTKYGQAFGATANGDGSWGTASGGPGGTLSRKYYEQFTVTTSATGSVRLDSVIVTSAFYNTSSNTKLAVVYSKTGFTTADSTDVSGATGPGVTSAAYGSFAAPILLANQTGGPTNVYHLALNGGTGVTLTAGQTLTFRVYFSCGSSSAGRYGTLKNVYVKGAPIVCNAAFSYAGSPFCKSSTTNPTPTITGTTGGTFSSTTGLTINSTTGAITLSNSTAGTYTVTYTASAGCTSTQSVTITAPPTANIGYGATSYCTTTTGTVALGIGTGSTLGTITVNPTTGLTFGANGAITPATSTPGTYFVTNTVAASGGCAAVTGGTTVTIAAPATANFAYPTATSCAGTATALTPTLATGATAGTYSLPTATGLSINATTGVVTVATTAATGTYTVTNTVAASGGCAAVTATASFTVAPATAATFSYTGSPFCTTGTTVTPTITGTAGGTFSSTTGLSLNATTGAITPGSSTAGTYTVTYTVAGSCGSSSTQGVTITAPQVATFAYPTAANCAGTATTLTPTLAAGATAGTYSLPTTPGLSVNATTGVVTVAATAAAGTYTVTNTLAASGGCAATTSTASFVLSGPSTATFSYANSPFCTSGTPVTPSITGTAGGTFSSTSGLSINATTGVITLGTSTAGTYVVTYTVAGTCGSSSTQTVTVTAPQTANFSYPVTANCAGTATTLTPTLASGAAAGTYSLPTATGLTINATTGVVTVAASAAAGTYTVTNTLAATGGCAAVTSTATFILSGPSTATFSYAGSPFCVSGTNPTPSITGTAGGTFSSTTGLSLNASTGVLNLSASTPGTYTITYTVAGTCGSSATQTVTINAAPTAGFSYGAGPYCVSGTTNPVVTLAAGVTAGTFSSTAGLSLNATTGAITLSTSAPGTYIVTNTLAAAGGCAQVTSTQAVTITAPQAAGFSYATSTVCAGSTATFTPALAAGATAGTYTLPTATGLSINATTGVVTVAASAVAGTYTVTNTVAASGGCAAATITAVFTVNPVPATPVLSTSGAPATGITLTSTSATGNQFYLNGVAIAGATGQTYLVNSGTKNGSYTVTVTNALGCSATSTAVTVTVTATAAAQAGTSLTLYPNPTRDGLLTLELSGYRETVQVSVVNALGQRVYEATVSSTGLSPKQALNLSGLATGVYTLQARTASGSVETRRIVRE